MSFSNDYHMILDFGKFKGKRICDCSENYVHWIAKQPPSKNSTNFNDIREAIIRIHNRVPVTTAIRNVTFKVPELKLFHTFTPLIRPRDVEPQWFGTFFELLVKFWGGMRYFDCVRDVLASCGLREDPSLTVPEPRQPTDDDLLIYKAYKKLLDVETPQIEHMNYLGIISGISKYKKNWQFINQEELWNQREVVYIPTLSTNINAMNNQISVGCITGICDAISGSMVYDFKVCKEDSLDSWSKQIYAYGCLLMLRRNTRISDGCVINYLTGNVFVAEFNPKEDPRNYIRELGNHCPEHVKLLS